MALDLLHLRESFCPMWHECAFANLDLCRRIEAGWTWTGVESALAYAKRRPENSVAVEKIGSGAATFFGQGSPLSQAQGLGLQGPVDDEVLDRLEAFYGSRGMPTNIEVASLADPSFLPKLSSRGYRVAEQTHMLARSIAGGESWSDSEPSFGILAERVTGVESLGEWSRVVLGGFFEGEDPPPLEISEVMAAMTAGAETSRWLATIDRKGSPGDGAAGASLLIHEGIALFAGDATIPRFRGRGGQRALILARLAASVEAGCQLAAVCVNPGTSSQRNYERQGFRLVYTRTLMTREPKAVSGFGTSPNCPL